MQFYPKKKNWKKRKKFPFVMHHLIKAIFELSHSSLAFFYSYLGEVKALSIMSELLFDLLRKPLNFNESNFSSEPNNHYRLYCKLFMHQSTRILQPDDPLCSGLKRKNNNTLFYLNTWHKSLLFVRSLHRLQKRNGQ